MIRCLINETRRDACLRCCVRSLPAPFELARFGYNFAHAAGQEILAKGAPGRLPSPAKQDAPLAEEVSSDHREPAFVPGGISNQSPGQWVSNSGERAARQVSLYWLIRI